ncbi:unnamed protein product [Diatraea saccharalis]|uniref:Uncharacterized protein n=1 Tax=Diatraea saccharalis TaxID=40085 RepID=A0A9N9N0J0_9NEOP|nr:unnamed protein product [Diatraea saccharalis]
MNMTLMAVPKTFVENAVVLIMYCKIVLPHKLRYLENMLNAEVVAKAARIRQRIEANPNIQDSEKGWPLLLAKYQADDKKNVQYNAYNNIYNRHLPKVFCGMLETAIHPKRVRVLPSPLAKRSRSETLWSSLEIITPSTPSISREQEAPSSVPSPALYVECGANSGTSTSTTKRSLSVVIQSKVMPRLARMYMDEENEEVEEGFVNTSMAWPPQSPYSSVCDPTPALPILLSLTPVSPTPASTTPVPPTPIVKGNKFSLEWRAFPMPQFESFFFLSLSNALRISHIKSAHQCTSLVWLP